MKSLVLLPIICFSVIAIGQNRYPESTSPSGLPAGLYYQGGPGSNNSSFNWVYPYGTKLSVIGSDYRNFELIATGYPYGDFKIRQYDPSNSVWSSWRDVLTSDENGNVGIGTSSPSKKLDVNGTIGAQDILVVQTGGSYKVAMNGQSNGYITGRNTSFENKFYITSNGTSYLNGGNIGIGTTTPDAKLAVNGNIHAKEVKVDLVGWPDYVFKEDYDLPALAQVEQHIKEKGHLINIPSAQEVEENGVQLGEINKLLLEKIEELTLYTLQQQKEIEDVNNLKAEFELLKKSYHPLLKRMEQLEKQQNEKDN